MPFSQKRLICLKGLEPANTMPNMSRMFRRYDSDLTMQTFGLHHWEVHSSLC